MTVMTAIGLMSGTSLDGIDIALVETDGENIKRFGPTGYRAYGASERACLHAALEDAAQLSDRDHRPGLLAEAEAIVTRGHQLAVKEFLAANGLLSEQIDIIGFHGQTMLHRPEQRLTVQIGDGAELAQDLGIPVVYDLRAADIAAGGQGAPLVPIFHRALAEAAGIEKPVAIVNIGGVANVTLIDELGNISSFDTGPGNALIDDWMHEKAGLPFDDDGQVAARGQVDEETIGKLLSHPFFRKPPPKSLDRNWFRNDIVSHLSVEDGAATLTALTVRTIARSLDHSGFQPKCWIMAGGGALNGEIRKRLAEISGIEVKTADSIGWSSAFLEAQAFAYLAVRSAKGMPLTFPSTTGAPEAMTGGVLVRPLSSPAFPVLL